MSREEESIWIRTESTIDGQSYAVTVEFGSDLAIGLAPDEALAYAQAITEAANRAEYDTLVIRQMLNITKEDPGKIVSLVADLRKRRPDIGGTGPLCLTPSVAMDPDGTYRPFIRLEAQGEPIGQWDCDTARQHATAMMDAIAVADLDNDYADFLTEELGLERGVAQSVVRDLLNWR